MITAVFVARGYVYAPELQRLEAPTPTVVGAPADGVTDYQQAEARARRELDARLELARKQPTSWLPLERVAQAHLALARLTGDLDEYAAADKAIADAFERAIEGSGPFLTRAEVNFAIHRLDATLPDLDKADSITLVKKPTRAVIVGLRADVAFHRGQYADALHLYRTSDDMRPTMTSAFRLAFYHWKTGDFDQAEKLMDQAEERIKGPQAMARAWLHLQRGLMDLERGRLDDARAHYRVANQLFSGWWLIEEHMAEIDALRGDTDQAERAYRDLIERTDNPEFMDALAALLRARGAEAEAAHFSERADHRYIEQLARLPEAAGGHALGHFLHSHDTERAVALAEANHALRPGGDGKLRLAQAYAMANRLDDALPLIEAVLASPYRTAEVHATAALLFEASNQTGKATEQKTLAVAIHPRAMDDVDWLRQALERRPV